MSTSQATIQGIFVPNIVPYDARGRIHEDELRRIIRWVGDKGVTGFTLAALFLALAPIHADVRLPSVLDDHMVLQQNCEVTIWGWAFEGEVVVIETSWGVKTQSVANAQGEWRVQVKTPAARPIDQGLHPEDITFTVAQENRVQIKDMLIGEVWLCSGQSNMTVRGVLWYQGESNVGDSATDYATLLKTLMADWRGRFGQNLPFGIVQLANYGNPWSDTKAALVREAQAVVAAEVPKTGMAVAIGLKQLKVLDVKDGAITWSLTKQQGVIIEPLEKAKK
jgi:hypothetical protein